MRLPFPLGLALVSILAGCAAPGARPSVNPEQAKAPFECGVTQSGHTLSLNGRVWVTESDEQMREWLGRIDKADVQSMEVLKGVEAVALYGVNGARSTVIVTLRPGSRSARRFRSPPPPPRSGHAYCCGLVRRFVESTRDTAGRATAPAKEPRSTPAQPPR